MKQLRKKEIKKLFKEVKRKHEVYVILENIQYARNVASIFRTIDAAGVRRLYLTGISQRPPFGKELRKTSRSKEKSVEWMYEEDTGKIINTLKKLGFLIIAIELTDTSKSIELLPELLSSNPKVCFIFGSEVFGVKKTTLEKVDTAIHIPMYGRGASLNVSTSVGITLYSF